MLRRCLGFAALTLLAVACLDLPGGGGNGTSDAGLTATTTAKLLGKWGSLLPNGSGDPNNAYYGWDLDGQPLSTGIHAQQWFNDVLGSEHEMCLNVTDRYGCTDTLCQVVSIVIPAIWSPNAFQPSRPVTRPALPRIMYLLPMIWLSSIVFWRFSGVK